MSKSKLAVRLALGTALSATIAIPASATETVTYVYDALGRLVGQTTSGTVNNGDAVTFCYDHAGNRIKMVADTTGSIATCPTPTPTPTPAPGQGSHVVVPMGTGFALIFIPD